MHVKYAQILNWKETKELIWLLILFSSQKNWKIIVLWFVFYTLWFKIGKTNEKQHTPIVFAFVGVLF